MTDKEHWFIKTAQYMGFDGILPKEIESVAEALYEQGYSAWGAANWLTTKMKSP